MSFQLARREDGKFEGATGARLRIGVLSARPASLVRIEYAGVQIAAQPFEFDIKNGENKLLVLVLGAENGQEMEVVELAGEEQRRLKRFFWSQAHPHATLDVVGV